MVPLLGLSRVVFLVPSRCEVFPSPLVMCHHAFGWGLGEGGPKRNGSWSSFLFHFTFHFIVATYIRRKFQFLFCFFFASFSSIISFLWYNLYINFLTNFSTSFYSRSPGNSWIPSITYSPVRVSTDNKKAPLR